MARWLLSKDGRRCMPLKWEFFDVRWIFYKFLKWTWCIHLLQVALDLPKKDNTSTGNSGRQHFKFLVIRGLVHAKHSWQDWVIGTLRCCYRTPLYNYHLMLFIYPFQCISSLLLAVLFVAQILCIDFFGLRAKFLNHFAFTLGRYLFLLFLV